MSDNLQRFIENADYAVKVYITQNEWQLHLPNNKEFLDKPAKTIIYHIDDISNSGIPFYCITYYIMANIIHEIDHISYNASLITYYYENEEISYEDIIFFYVDKLTKPEYKKLELLTSLFDKIIHIDNSIITNDVLIAAKNGGIEKDLLLLYYIVKKT